MSKIVHEIVEKEESNLFLFASLMAVVPTLAVLVFVVVSQVYPHPDEVTNYVLLAGMCYVGFVVYNISIINSYEDYIPKTKKEVIHKIK